MKKNSNKKNIFRVFREDMDKVLEFYGKALTRIYG